MRQARVNLEAQRVSLRELRFFDLLDVYANIRDKEVTKWTSSLVARPKKSVRQHTCAPVNRFCSRLLGVWKMLFKPKVQTVFKFAVVLKETGKVIGVVSLVKCPPKEGNFADIGFWIGKRYWGKGLMTEAVKLGLDAGFNDLKLERIRADTRESNVASRKVLEKSGLRCVSVGEYPYIERTEKRCRYAISKSEFEKIKRSGNVGIA